MLAYSCSHLTIRALITSPLQGMSTFLGWLHRYLIIDISVACLQNRTGTELASQLARGAKKKLPCLWLAYRWFDFTWFAVYTRYSYRNPVTYHISCLSTKMTTLPGASKLILIIFYLDLSESKGWDQLCSECKKVEAAVDDPGIWYCSLPTQSQHDRLKQQLGCSRASYQWGLSSLIAWQCMFNWRGVDGN